MLRQPIITVLGHVDHGKTTILDSIRQTAIAAKEAGGITQAIGTTEIPAAAVENMCMHLLEKFNFKITVPGLLFIDTPGHEAFTTLRKRGGSIADLAILVVDINEGIMPQTAECIDILKAAKTPFIMAMNKIDRIHGWSSGDKCFMHNYPQQADDVKEEFEKMFYKITERMHDYGFHVERFDRISDFSKTVAAVPVSAKTGEGISDMLVTLAGLAQQFLGKQLETTEKSCGIILEVKESVGLGATIDCIIYDGIVRKTDFLVLANPAMIARIRALLVPEAMRDMRTEKKFHAADEVAAAAGVRIAAPGLSSTSAGSEIRTARSMKEAELLLDELDAQRHEVEIFTEKEGLLLKADTLGGLEALINIFRKHPIRQASIGRISRKDIIDAGANKETRVIIGFNAPAPEDVAAFARDTDVKIFGSDVIYSLIEEYEKWVDEKQQAGEEQKLALLSRPGKIKLLPGCVFRQSNPAIVGCEVLAGLIKPGCRLFKDSEEVLRVGEIKQIQSQGKNVQQAQHGERVAVSIAGPTIGRQIDENDILYTEINSHDFLELKEHEAALSKSELEALEEIVQISRRHNPNWGIE